MILDYDILNEMDIELIHNHYVTIENNNIRHNVNKLSVDVYSYLIR